MAWNWSTDWTTQAGVDFTDLAAGPFPMFVRALVERYRVAYAADFTNAPVAADDAVWASALTLGVNNLLHDGHLNWGTLQGLVDSLCTYFVRSGSWVGTPLIKNLRYGDQNNTTIDATFPAPNGWSRAFPRTIYTLSQPGVAGQRARFEACTGQNYYGVLHTDPLFGTIVTTPSGERSNTGKYFVYQSGAWTLDASSQASPPDVVTEFKVLAQPGDYITGQMLNDIRDALNQCIQTFIIANPSTSPLSPIWTNVQQYTISGTPADFAPPNDIFGSGTGTSIATADANYVGGSTWPWGSPNSVTGYREVCAATSVTYSTYNVVDCSSVLAFVMYKVPYTFTSHWYFVAVPFEQTSTYTFDAQGTTALNGQWQSFGTTAGAANVDNLVGPRLPGTLPAPPAPNWSNKGWELSLAAGLLSWDVAGGFKYVSGYAGT